MKVVVCVKWVGALGDDIEFDDEGNVDPDYLDYALNEWDSSAAAEAIRLRDAAGGGEVVVVTVGSEEAEEALVQCLAMGADRAVRVASDEQQVHDPLTVARHLAAVVSPERPDLVLCGAQSSDAAQGSTGSALAGMLGLPVAAVVTKVEYDPSAGQAMVQRELEGGVIDVVEIQTPAVLTIQTGIIEPPYVTMRAIQQAGQSEIQVVDSAEVESGEPGYRVRSMAEAPKARAEMIEGEAPVIAETIRKLIREATV
jgi:electron transfer flavoprotein beta subunit